MKFNPENNYSKSDIYLFEDRSTNETLTVAPIVTSCLFYTSVSAYKYNLYTWFNLLSATAEYIQQKL